MKLTVTFCFILVLHLSVKAQISNIQGLDNVVIRVKKYQNISGTAYLYEEWRRGAIMDKSDRLYSDIQLKYDTYKDRIEINQEGQSIEIDPEYYPQFSIERIDNISKLVTRQEFISGLAITGFTSKNYFELLVSDRIKLVKKYVTNIQENVPAYGTSGMQKSFQLKTYYFVLSSDIKSIEIKSTKKSLINAFPDKSIAIENFLKTSQIKLKTELDLIKVINFINTL